nr:hypothetical protein [Tanacetum cinerariifolium]
MAPLTFADNHNMVAFLSKSDASVGFDQIVDFLNAQIIQYALTVNPTIYVSYDADGVECLPNEEIFTELARMGFEKSPPKLTFYKAFFSGQWKFLIHTLVQCVSAKRTAWNKFSCSMASAVIYLATGRKFNFSKVGKGFSKVEFPLFSTLLVQPQPPAAEEKDEVEVPNAPTPPYLTTAPSPPLQDPIPTPSQAQPATPHVTPPQGQPIDTSESSMTLLNTLMETWGKIKVIDADEDITLVDAETQVDMDAELQGWIDDVSVTATKEVNAAEPTMFDDKEEVEQAAGREKQEKYDLEKAKGLQQQYDEKQENIDWKVVAEQIQEKHLDNIRKYQSLKRKPISIVQARKNMIIYLKNMDGYKMEHFRGMTYDKKKRVAERTLLQESFKKLKAVEVSGFESTQDTPTNDPKEMSKEDVQNMLEIIPVSEFKVEALQVKYPLIDWEIHSEGSRTYWKIIRVGGITNAYQSFKDMLKGFDKEDLVALHDIFMLTEKDYPLSNAVMIMMLSAKLQVEEDSEMARDLVMKIFIEANKLKSRSLDISSK